MSNFLRFTIGIPFMVAGFIYGVFAESFTVGHRMFKFISEIER